VVNQTGACTTRSNINSNVVSSLDLHRG
jgi:hypothetical protein